MKAGELLDAIGEARDEYVHDVRNANVKKISGWAKWTSAIAACLVLTVGAGLLIGGLGGNSGSGGDLDQIYMSYSGPVLPMTILGENPGITAERTVNFDFSPYISYQTSYQRDGETVWYYRAHSESVVTDSYVLRNESPEDQSVTLLYPYPASLQDLANEDHFLDITVDGEPVTPQFHPGPDTGSFGGLNLSNIESFDGYRALLSDDTYQTSAFDDFPILDQAVVVYRLSDYGYSKDTEAENPTIQMSFQIDFENTVVFTFGMNGGSVDSENGFFATRKGAVRYDPDQDPYRMEPEDAFVILLGKDISEYEIQGYQNGGCNEGEELDDLTCSVTRYETNLRQILFELCRKYWNSSTAFAHSPELYCALAAEVLEEYGVLSDAHEARYAWCRIEDLLSDTYYQHRVNYYLFEIRIPAGETSNVEVNMRKEDSTDYVGKGKNVDGYEMATQLGSNLVFTEQRASVSGFDEIEIVAQNFGFDPDNGITSVTLDPNQELYWIQIRKIFVK